jgi:nitrogen-specific signal transduction histidine kinase
MSQTGAGRLTGGLAERIAAATLTQIFGYPMDRAATLDLIFTTLRSGVLAINHDGALLLLNPTGSTILAVDPEHAQGRPYADVFSSHPQLVEFLSDALRVNTVLDRAEIQLHSPRHMTLGLTAAPLPSPTGGGTVVLFKDLTQVERMEEQTQLKERLAALGQMAAGLAHEMRNPLASIKVSVGLLRKTLAADPDIDKKLRSIMGDLQRLNQSVTDCLAFARPIRLEPKYVQINEVIEKVLNQTVLLEHTYPFEVVRRFDADLPKTWVDPQQLENVFFNLINNAIDAVRQRHGRIIISTGVKRGAGNGQDELDTTIADNGEGIPPDRLGKVFMPFFTTKGKGSGLGLANAKKILDHLHGTIQVTSEPGVGTRFSVRIPMIATLAERALAG